MKPSKYILFALFMLAFLPAFSGDIRMGIAPNPANNQVSVSIDGTTNGGQQHPEIYTLLGVKVSAAQWRREGNTFIFNTSAIPDGIYLVRYGNGEQAVVKQLKIQHQ
ncbi:MAG: T9SS type A sorting domain-containing protein [Sphingomonadales bacterium]